MRRADRVRRAAIGGGVVLMVAGGCAAAPVVADPPLPPGSPPPTSAPAATAGPAAPSDSAALTESALFAGAVDPVAVRIPGIDVASELLSLGIDADGAAEVPQDFDRVGWFTGGGRPGGRGPTVLLGHVDSTAGPAAFYRLRDLAPGDVIELDTADGGVARYAVDRTEQVPKDTFPTFAVFGATAQDVLRLVTCAGDFDRGARSYTDNLVVHATRLPA